MKSNIFNKLMTIFAGLMLCFIVGTIIYNEASISEVTVVMKLKPDEDPFVAIKAVCSGQCAIRSIHEVNKATNEYEVKIATKKPLTGLLDWIKKNSRIEHVEIKQ